MSTTETVTLSDFLLARIAEDEAMAQRYSPHWRDGEGLYGVCAAFVGYGDEGADDSDTDIAIAPARVLAECEARRERVELLAHVIEDPDSAWPYPARSLAKDLLYHEAKLWSEHPDFTEDWKP